MEINKLEDFASITSQKLLAHYIVRNYFVEWSKI